MRNEFEASGGAEGLGSTSGEKSMRSLESECNPICDSDLVPTGIRKIYLMIFPVDCDVSGEDSPQDLSSLFARPPNISGLPGGL